jgi:hypothetical protein
MSVQKTKFFVITTPHILKTGRVTREFVSESGAGLMTSSFSHFGVLVKSEDDKYAVPHRLTGSGSKPMREY